MRVVWLFAFLGAFHAANCFELGKNPVSSLLGLNTNAGTNDNSQTKASTGGTKQDTKKESDDKATLPKASGTKTDVKKDSDDKPKADNKDVKTPDTSPPKVSNAKPDVNKESDNKPKVEIKADATQPKTSVTKPDINKESDNKPKVEAKDDKTSTGGTGEAKPSGGKKESDNILNLLGKDDKTSTSGAGEAKPSGGKKESDDKLNILGKDDKTSTRGTVEAKISVGKKESDNKLKDLGKDDKTGSSGTGGAKTSDNKKESENKLKGVGKDDKTGSSGTGGAKTSNKNESENKPKGVGKDDKSGTSGTGGAKTSNKKESENKPKGVGKDDKTGSSGTGGAKTSNKNESENKPKGVGKDDKSGTSGTGGAKTSNKKESENKPKGVGKDDKTGSSGTGGAKTSNKNESENKPKGVGKDDKTGTSGTGGAKTSNKKESENKPKGEGKDDKTGTSGTGGAKTSNKKESENKPKGEGKDDKTGSSGTGGAKTSNKNESENKPKGVGKDDKTGTSGTGGAKTSNKKESENKPKGEGKDDKTGTSGTGGAKTSNKKESENKPKGEGKDDKSGTSGTGGAKTSNKKESENKPKGVGKDDKTGSSGTGGAKTSNKNESENKPKGVGKDDKTGTSGTGGAKTSNKKESENKPKGEGKDDKTGTSGTGGAKTSNKKESENKPKGEGKDDKTGTNGTGGAKTSNKKESENKPKGEGKDDKTGTSGTGGAKTSNKKESENKPKGVGKDDKTGTSGTGGAKTSNKKESENKPKGEGKDDKTGTSGTGGAKTSNKKESENKPKGEGKDDKTGTSGTGGAKTSNKKESENKPKGVGKDDKTGTSGTGGAKTSNKKESENKPKGVGKDDKTGTSGTGGAKTSNKKESENKPKGVGKDDKTGTSGTGGAKTSNKKESENKPKGVGKDDKTGTSGTGGAKTSNKKESENKPKGVGKDDKTGTSGTGGAKTSNKKESENKPKGVGKDDKTGTSGTGGAKTSNKKESENKPKGVGKDDKTGTSGTGGAKTSNKKESENKPKGVGKDDKTGTSGTGGAKTSNKKESENKPKGVGKDDKTGTSGTGGAKTSNKKESENKPKGEGKDDKTGTSGTGGAKTSNKKESENKPKGVGKDDKTGTSGTGGAKTSNKKESENKPKGEGKDDKTGSSGTGGAKTSNKKESENKPKGVGKDDKTGTSGTGGAKTSNKKESENKPKGVGKDEKTRSSGTGKTRSNSDKKESDKKTKDDKTRSSGTGETRSSGGKKESEKKPKEPKCKDVTIESINLLAKEIQLDDKVVSVKLSKQISIMPCTSGVTFGFKGNKVYTLLGCRGVFSVCTQEQEAPEPSSNVQCNPPFINVYGYCVIVERDAERTYSDSEARCSEYGGQLLDLENVAYSAAGIKDDNLLKGRKYFIKGGSFDNSFVNDIAEKYKIPVADCHSALKRFSNKATVTDLNRPSAIASLCPILDFKETNSVQLVNCQEKYGAICVERPKEDGDWTPFINSNKADKDGDDENLRDIAKSVAKGILTGIRLCRKPLGVRCRAVGTQDYYDKSNTHGLKLDRACDNNGIKCSNKKQDKGITCPEFEIQFLCPEEILKDCAVDSVRRECEQQRKECVMSALGAVCVKKQKERTGKEVIGTDECTINSQTYQLFECESKGDPHYTTPDGSRIDFQGTCTYVLAQTCNDFVETEYLPAFSVWSSNQKDDPSDKVSITKAFYFILNGCKYLFKENGFFSKDGIQRNPVEYADDQIEIDAQPKGDTVLFTIRTKYCIIIRWDNRQGLSVLIPESYKNKICGICGNFDGDPTNDLTIPGSNKTVTEDVLGRYHMVAGESGSGCVDVTNIPKACSPQDKAKFSALDACGHLNPDITDNFASKALSGCGGESKSINKKRLANIFDNCVRDHCWMTNFTGIGRCHALESAIGEVSRSLAFKVPKPDDLWRKSAGCDKDAEVLCGGRNNTVYSSSYLQHCQDSCAERTKSVTCRDLETSSGCVCKEGYLLDSKLNCVPEIECDKSCVALSEKGEKMQLQDGETVVKDPCRKTLTCNNGVLEEKELGQCSDNAECVNNGKTCACRPGFQGNGYECNSIIKCRKGYKESGSKCRKLSFEKATWQSAAVSCGADGAQLARYDSDLDLSIAEFVESAAQESMLSTATSRCIQCSEKGLCSGPKNQVIVSVRVKDTKFLKDCEGKLQIQSGRTKFTVGVGCKAKDFIAETVESKNFISPQLITAWVGGNTNVLSPNKRPRSRPACNFDAPRLLDIKNIQNSFGCFQATKTSDGLVVNPNQNCDELLPYICEYDNTKENQNDLNDFQVIREKCNQQEAVDKCAAIGRPLVTIKNKEQLDLAQSYANANGDNIWASPRFDPSRDDYISADGITLSASFSTFKTKPEPKVKFTELHCISVNKKGVMSTEQCQTKYYPLCGPRSDITPFVFSPSYPVDGFSSLIGLQQKLQRQEQQDYACDKPADFECSARAKTGQWVTNKNQQGTTITCRADKITCLDNQELDCSTFQVRVLCPQSDNLCKEMTSLGAAPCEGGQTCIPVRNHVVCQCPLGSVYDPHSKNCISFCGECSAWGDPHYTTFKQNKYNFMGTCTYLFSGVCNVSKVGSAPSYEVLTKNSPCGNPGATCISRVDVVVRNIPVIENGVEVKKTLVFRVRVDASSYTLNDVEISQTEYGIEGVYTAIVKRAYFEVTFPRLGLSVFLSGSQLRVQAPGQFVDNMCGLCGNCQDNKFRLRNGTVVSVPIRNVDLDDKTMALIASDSKVYDPESDSDQCDVPVAVPADRCNNTVKAQLVQPNRCGVFLDNSSAIQECFTKTTLDRNAYYQDCLYDACLQTDIEKAVCTIVKTFAQKCASLGVVLDWRRENFCPMDCGSKVYRADASCEPTCGRSIVSQQVCKDTPNEGCVCPVGLMRQGDTCVKPESCGCKVYLSDGKVTWSLPLGESFLLPNCREKVTCLVNDDGTGTLVSAPFNLPCNAECDSEIPPSVKCARGYSKAADGSCQRDQTECLKGYVDVKGTCLKVPDEPKTWRGAVQVCNEANGKLVDVDTDGKAESLLQLLKDKNLAFARISGKVRALKVLDKVTFQPILSVDEQNKIEWGNFHCGDSVLKKIKLSSSIPIGSIPATGLVLSVIARKTNAGLTYEAVTSDTPANFVCEERKVKDNETQWYPPCNTDTDMSDDGDIESRRNLILNPDCLICPEPMEVRCVVNPNRVVEGSVEGVCENNANGDYYYCNDGRNCIDKGVSTRCAKDADECVTGRHDCPANSKCINTVGGYSCQCNADFPLMINGECKAADTCIMSGPSSPLDYVYDIQGFSGIPGKLSYDCKMKIAYICANSSYDPKSGVPFFSLYDISQRLAGVQNQYLSGSFYEPTTKGLTRCGITDELLKQGQFLYAEKSDDPVITSLGFFDKKINTHFQWVAPGTLIIRHASNYFKATISTGPTRVQLELSDAYRNLICGVCRVTPDYRGANIVLTEAQINEVSVSPEEQCAPRNNPSPQLGSPSSPENPSEPEIPTLPGSSSSPEYPSEPEIRPLPGSPSSPESQSEPEIPTLPGSSSSPEYPSEPEIRPLPGSPSSPESQSEPEIPTLPSSPESPSEPEIPILPGNPSSPENPSAPESPISPDGNNTPGPVFTLPPVIEETRPPIPIESIPPVRDYTLPPVIPTEVPETDITTVIPVIPDVEPSIPTDPEEDPCNDQAIAACAILNLICRVPLIECRKSVCSGRLSICSYLATENFDSCRERFESESTELKELVRVNKCDQICGPNMQFLYTPRSKQPTCSDPILSTSLSESSDSDYGFACVCDGGFVQSQTDCVRESDCGCVMPNGAYQPPGKQWRSDDCSYLLTCRGNNKVDIQAAPCGQNTECVIGERGPACQCKEGLYGNPDMPEGCKPGEVSPDGSKTCYDYAQDNGQNDTRCDCNMGYVSNCDDCEDIDECKEGLHECDLSIQKCINVPGGYQCSCAEGFYYKRGQCIDVNECTKDSNICGEHAECKNTEGSYECVCCAGYLWNPALEFCEREPIGFPTLPPNASCCATCNDPLCEESNIVPTPYCLTEDGERSRFPNFKRLYQELCINNQPLDKDQITAGNCPVNAPPPSDGSGSPSQPSVPPTCDGSSLCASLPPPPPALAQGPVCGPSNSQTPKTYPSYCDMVKDVCKSSGGPTSLPKDSPIKATPGSCSPGDGPPKPVVPPAQPIFTPWSPYSQCFFQDELRNCGEGTQVRNRQVVPYDDLRVVRPVEPYETTERRPCFEPCVNDYTGLPEGNCPAPSVCTARDPVCGSIGSGAAQEYESECVLNVAACEAAKVPHKLYSGSCDPEDGTAQRRYCEEAGPVQVSVKYDIEKDGNHYVGEPVTIGSCGDLLCPGEAGTCCRATEFEQIQVTVRVFSQATRLPLGESPHVYVSATKCECIGQTPVRS